MEIHSNPLISIKHLSVYHRKNLVLSDVNISIEKGEFVYVIGKTGTGKSSLLRTLYADIPVLEGNVSVAEYDLVKMKSKDIPYFRRKLGIVFQDFQLLSDRNAHENLSFVLKSTGWKDSQAIETRIEEVLTKVGLATKAYKRPHQLSGGEQQRLAIARALLNDPELILADEPTGNLDPDTSEEIIKLLLEISGSGRTVVLATHDFLMISKYPSRILVCDGGKVYHENL